MPKPFGLKRPNTPESISPDDDREEWMCDCRDRGKSSLPLKDDFFLCGRCLKHQHHDCATTDFDTANSKYPPCNRCEEAELERLLQEREREIEEMSKLVQAKIEEKRELYETVLWQHYCLLPNTEDTPDFVVEATRTEYDEGKTMPVYEAPKEWLDEVTMRVGRMMDAAGEEMAEYCMQGSKSYTDPHEALLMSWREMALWIVSHGAYRGRREELGVLAEVVGLSEKGRFWRNWQYDDDEVGKSVEKEEEGVKEEEKLKREEKVKREMMEDAASGVDDEQAEGGWEGSDHTSEDGDGDGEAAARGMQGPDRRDGEGVKGEVAEGSDRRGVQDVEMQGETSSDEDDPKQLR